MNNNDNNSRLEELLKKISDLLTSFEENLNSADIEEDLWDTSDIIRNWHVSERTLATWRKKKLIGYIQVGSKLWYPKLAREEFLLINFIDNGLPIEGDKNLLGTRINPN